MIFDDDNQVFSFFCGKENPSLFKKIGYSKKGRALLYVPLSVDIVFFDMKKEGWRQVTDNLVRLIGPGFTKNIYDAAFDITKSLGGESGYYLMNHSTRRGRRLGNKSDWDVIVDQLDGQHPDFLRLPKQ